MKHDKCVYDYEPWTVTEKEFDLATNQRSETIFTVGNGYIGMRGNFEEGLKGADAFTLNGTYLNGFYDSTPIIYGEEAYGYAKNHQTMLNVTDSKLIELVIDGEIFNMNAKKFSGYERKLDMRKGMMLRNVTWETSTGKQVEISVKRMASLTNKHVALIQYAVKLLNFSGEVTLVSSVNGEVTNKVSVGDPRVGSALKSQVLRTMELVHEDTMAAIRQKTTTTEFALVCGIDHLVNVPYELETELKEQVVQKKFVIKAQQGQVVELEKFITYYSSKDYAEAELLELAQKELMASKELGFAGFASKQEACLDEFWEVADIVVEGDDALQQGLRFNAYHLFQSVGRDGKTNIAAKGITGEGYEGHYFWDTETYILPFFLYTEPEIAKKLLDYRHHILPKARERAIEMAGKGALFPWRTIDGEEASAYYPAGTAQFHINADVAHALINYVHTSGDEAFLHDKGLEILIETCRFFANAGDWVAGKGFCINGVTGPDEYTAVVNNNTYTNMMVKNQMEYTARVLCELKQSHSGVFAAVQALTQVNDQEIAEWDRMADNMYIHRSNGLIGQDDTFLEKAVWDFEGTPKEKYPLLLHFHPLVIYRHQVLKQADLVLAFYLQSDRFTRLEKVRNYKYYEPLTTHDSSLSACIHAIVGAELGYMDKAYDFFMQSARMDLDDVHGNAKDGIHAASMAGSWLTIVSGFAGMRHHGDGLSFEPKQPERWKGYTFRLKYRGRVVQVQVSGSETTYRLVKGEPIAITHYGVEFVLDGERTVMNRELKAVIFDLDGVLTDTAEYHYLAWKELADELGIPFDREFNENLKGVDRMASFNLILSRSDLQLSEEEKVRLATSKNDRYKKLIEQMGPEDLLPGAVELLQSLKEQGIKVALASASKNAQFIVERLDIAKYFDHIVDANIVEIQKPDSEVFIRAAEAVGAHPHHCIGVEDAAAGIEAIRNCGMLAVGIGNPELLAQAEHNVDAMRDLTLEVLRGCIR